MEPVYFGEQNSLFGFYHPAKAGALSGGVVLCPPLFNEYFRTYQIQKELAQLLSDTGFDVLRFDYRGTGDAKGSLEDYDLTDWRLDVRSAISELRELSGQDSTILFGIRYAVSLMSEAAMDTGVKGVVLWDPIVGQDYIEQLNMLSEGLAKEYRDTHSNSAPVYKGSELAGYAVNANLVDQIKETKIEHWGSLTVRVLLSSEGKFNAPAQWSTEKVPFQCQWTNSAGPLVFAKELVDRLFVAVNEVNL